MNIQLKNKLRVPFIWKDLLALESFEALLDYPKKAFGPSVHEVSVSDPNPYRDDGREVVVEEGPYTVVIGLMSGGENYWLNYLVHKNGDVVYEFGEPFFDIPSSDTLKLSTGETIEFGIELV